MKDFGLLLIRLVTGGLLAGHGAQKMWGSFGGPGFRGTSQRLDSMGLKPGSMWAAANVMGELAGGALMALGFLNPIGPLLSISAMAMATAKVHWNKPIWGTKGGPELPVTNAAIATAVGIGGPGKYSLDRLFRIRIPTSILAIIFSATTLVLAYGISQKPEPQNQTGGGNA